MASHKLILNEKVGLTEYMKCENCGDKGTRGDMEKSTCESALDKGMSKKKKTKSGSKQITTTTKTKLKVKQFSKELQSKINNYFKDFLKPAKLEYEAIIAAAKQEGFTEEFTYKMLSKKIVAAGYSRQTAWRFLNFSEGKGKPRGPALPDNSNAVLQNQPKGTPKPEETSTTDEYEKTQEAFATKAAAAIPMPPESKPIPQKPETSQEKEAAEYRTGQDLAEEARVSRVIKEQKIEDIMRNPERVTYTDLDAISDPDALREVAKVTMSKHSGKNESLEETFSQKYTIEEHWLAENPDIKTVEILLKGLVINKKNKTMDVKLPLLITGKGHLENLTVYLEI